MLKCRYDAKELQVVKDEWMNRMNECRNERMRKSAFCYS